MQAFRVCPTCYQVLLPEVLICPNCNTPTDPLNNIQLTPESETSEEAGDNNAI